MVSKSTARHREVRVRISLEQFRRMIATIHTCICAENKSLAISAPSRSASRLASCYIFSPGSSLCTALYNHPRSAVGKSFETDFPRHLCRIRLCRRELTSFQSTEWRASFRINSNERFVPRARSLSRAFAFLNDQENRGERSHVCCKVIATTCICGVLLPMVCH